MAAESHTTTIVSAFLRNHFVGSEQIPDLIKTVYSTIVGLGRPETVPEAPRTPAVPMRSALKAEHITCLDCGWKGQTLKRHLGSKHGLSPFDYRLRWNLQHDYPMTAPNYSVRRSAFAKDIGLGRRPAAPTPEPPAAPPKKPTRRRAAASRAAVSTRRTGKRTKRTTRRKRASA